jgi:hypothetical protein
MLKKFFYAAVLVIAFTTKLFAQDSSRLQISLLTCQPGQDLNELFGHSALRIIDSNSVNDYVYNYGTFDFDDKNFYIKFIRGKLLYFVDIANYNDFIGYYFANNRQITEQVLSLTAAEKKAIYNAVILNCKEENKYYKYDFFFDNCTTRLKDLIEKYAKTNSRNTATMPLNYTFRNAIHQYLDNGQQPWSKLGIDILLGAKTDAVMTASQQQFLPENLLAALDKANNPNIIAQKKEVFQLQQMENKGSFFSPLVASILFCLAFGSVFIWGNRKLQKLLTGFLFLLAGLFGILLLFMWFGTDHIATKNNYNLLWASPLFLLFLFNKNGTLKKSIAVILILSLLFSLLGIFFLAQKLNAALIPFVVLLLWRVLHVVISKNNFHAKTN